MWAAPVTGAPAHEHRALHQLLGKPASPAPRRDAKVLDVGDMSVVFAHVDPLWLRFSTPELEAAFQKDAFHSASAMHHWQSLCMLMLLLAQWVLHLARTGINPTTSFWRSAPNQVLYRICIILAYMSGRALLYLSVPAQRGDALVRQVFILINMVPRLFMISQWLLSLRRHGWPAYRAATLNEYHHTPLDCPAGAVMVLTVFFLPIMVQLHFCGPLTRIMMLLTVMVSLMTPHAALPDDDSAISLLTVHLVASVAAHFLELIARVAYMRQAKLLVHMRQQMAADSKLNHLLKNKCAEARAEIEALQDLADSPELVARLASVDALMEQTIQWTHRREVLLQLERGIYTSQLRPTVLRDAFKQVCGGRHARAEIVLEVDEVIEVDAALLKLLLEEGMSNAIKYRQPGTKLTLKASQRAVAALTPDKHTGIGTPTPATHRRPDRAGGPLPAGNHTLPPIQAPGDSAAELFWPKRGLRQEPLELYVQLTNANRADVRALTTEECQRAFEPGVTLDRKSTAASTGVGLHTVVLGVTSVGGRAWLSTETLPATADHPAQAVTTFHFTLPMLKQVEARKRLSLRQPGDAGAQGLRAAASTAGKRLTAGAAAGAATTLAVGCTSRPGRPTMVLEGLPFSKVVDRRGAGGDGAGTEGVGARRDGDGHAAIVGAGGDGSAREPPPAQSCSPNEHSQEGRDVVPNVHGGVSGSVVGAGGGSTSFEAQWPARGPPCFRRACSNQSDEDSPPHSATASCSDFAPLSFSDVLMYALDDSAILRSYMLNVFKRMGAHPCSRALGANGEEVDGFVDVALGLAPPYVPLRLSFPGSPAPSSGGSSPRVHGSGAGLRRRGSDSGMSPRRGAPSTVAPHATPDFDAAAPAGDAGRIADVVVLDYHIEMDDESVVNGGVIADRLRAKGFQGLIALFSGITMAEEAVILARGSIDIVIHKGSGPGAVQEQLTDAWLGHRARRSQEDQAGSTPPEGRQKRPSPLVPPRSASFPAGSGRTYAAGSSTVGSPGSGGGGRRARGEVGGGMRARSAKTGGLLGQSAQWF